MTPKRRARAIDIGVAVLATGAELGFLLDDGHEAEVTPILLAIATGAVLVGRRRAPLVVLAATLGGALGLIAIDASPAGVPALVALYTSAELQGRRASLAALVPTAVVLAVSSVASVPVTLAAWALGAYARSRRQALEREREQLARIAVHEERTAIARELHDIVAHSVTVMLLGVRGARDVLRTAPDEAEDALSKVEASGEQSLTELRRMLGVLREHGHGADSRPQPALADLDTLVASYRDTGLPVRLEVEGERRPLPAGTELSVYRVVEEALTNALKHADPTSVTVSLAFAADSLEFEVTNDGGPAPAATDGGHGVVGMRERLALLGGRLEAGERPGGGFRVAARIPIGGDA